MRLSSLPQVSHVPPKSYFSFDQTKKYLVRRTDPKVRYAILSNLLLPRPKPKFLPQYPIREHPQPILLPQCQKPYFPNKKQAKYKPLLILNFFIKRCMYVTRFVHPTFFDCTILLLSSACFTAPQCVTLHILILLP